jgi:hypothetical protein
LATVCILKTVMKLSSAVKISLIVFSLAMLVAAGEVLASSAAGEIGKQLGAAAGGSGAALGRPIDPRFMAALIIQVVLSIIGIVLIGLVVYSGFMWMTAGGNSEQVDTAKTTLRNAVIGLIIVISAYSITIFISNAARGYTNVYYGNSIWRVLPWVK